MRGYNKIEKQADTYKYGIRQIDRTRAIMILCAICAAFMIAASVYQICCSKNRQFSVKAGTVSSISISENATVNVSAEP